MSEWRCAPALDADRRIVSGSEGALADAVRRAADLRIYTEFIHNEHIDVMSEDAERVLKVAEFGVTYLLQNVWVAGVMSLRQPIDLPTGFGPRPSISFFLYNQNGQQAIARPHLGGVPATGSPGLSPSEVPPNMPKYYTQDSWDGRTDAPSRNFVYDLDVYRFCVGDTWQEAFSHGVDGAVHSGSLKALVEVFSDGCEVKVGVRGLCADLVNGEAVDHEVFV